MVNNMLLVLVLINYNSAIDFVGIVADPSVNKERVLSNGKDKRVSTG